MALRRTSEHKPAQSPKRQPPQTRSPQPASFDFASGLAATLPVFDFSRVSLEPPLQRKATIGSPADPFEREADEVAEKVTRERAVQATIQRIRTKSENSSSSSTLDADVALRVAESPSGVKLTHEARSYFEPRFGHDFSRVRVHTGPEAAQAASSIQARAYTVGTNIVYAAGAYAPGTLEGKRLMAHELAHVVQQRASPARSPGIQRFTEPGHKLLGDEAFGTGLLTLGGIRMTFGDAVATGDYFGSFKYMQDLAGKEGKGLNTKGVVLYVLWVKIRKHLPETKLRDLYTEDPVLVDEETSKNKDARVRDLYTKEAAFQADQLSRSLDSKNISHFPNPLAGDTALDPNQKNQRTVGEGADKKPLGAAATYRAAHEMAMQIAYINGTHYKDYNYPQNNDDALLADAYACHFLTDSFSASHVRTPRASIKEYWDAKVPGFRQKLIQWLADKVNDQPLLVAGHDVPGVNLGERILAPVAVGSTVRTAAVDQLTLLLSGGDFSFGDVVSLIVHDAEGARGVQATIEGKPITLVGDKGLVDEDTDPMGSKGEKQFSLKPDGDARQTADAAIAAVKASIDDVQNAYDAGLPENLMAGVAYVPPVYGEFKRTFHHKSFDALKKEALGKRGLYRAEQLVPTAVDDKLLPSDKKNLPWRQKSVDDFLNDKAIEAALVSFGDSEAQEFEDRLKDMKGLRPEHRAAIKRALLDPLASGDGKRIRKLLKSILDGTQADLQVGPQGVTAKH